MIDPLQKFDTATFGAGCFWCVEAVFQNLKGVDTVVSGYMGGELSNPSYRDVCSGTTGHAEVCQIYFDPQIISFQQLLEVFWLTHDPTTLNRQGADKGTQYRSVVFWHNSTQENMAKKLKNEFAQKYWDDPIVTEIVQANEFYPAEDYHQNYFNLNGEAPYCQIVISPKVLKAKERFSSLWK
ncbi:MAG TPA: peptide-methionine (S)-S-oxide reductase MsrA [Saprospiraceae bacterium]|nr:peptide-methionine (S)-S-oxide reductase MsrA [Saprospiraceae bacterium]